MSWRLGVFAVLFLTGCTVGPNYKKQAVDVPSQYRGASAEQQAASFGDQKWLDAFQDDALRNLIQTALEQNYDVRIAAARILEAQAVLGITRADQFPTVNADGTAARERLPKTLASPS